jgi:hypothetical protein
MYIVAEVAYNEATLRQEKKPDRRRKGSSWPEWVGKRKGRESSVLLAVVVVA